MHIAIPFVFSVMKERLSAPLHLSDVLELANIAAADEVRFESLFQYLFDDDKRTSDNAAWVLTHLPNPATRWLEENHEDLIDETMRTSSTTKRRLMMVLLDRQSFDEDKTRTDFLDFCFEKLLDPIETYGVRSLAAKLAYKQCHPYNELRAELRQSLELLERESLNPGLSHTRKELIKKLS